MLLLILFFAILMIRFSRLLNILISILFESKVYKKAILEYLLMYSLPGLWITKVPLIIQEMKK